MTGPFNPDRSRAVVIGTSTYTDPRLHDLPAVANNLNDLRAALEAPENPLVSAGHCRVIHDPAELGPIAPILVTAAKEAEDVFLLYYAGHGLLHGSNSDLHLALTGTDTDMTGLTALPYRLLQDVFQVTRAKVQIMILDCCYSGRAATMSDATSAIMSQIDVSGAYVLTSAPAHSPSIAVPGERHTAFTGNLLAVLTNGIPDAPDWLSLADIYEHLYRLLRAQGLPTPQQLTTNTVYRFPLAPNRANSAAALAGDFDEIVVDRTESDALTLANKEPQRALSMLRQVVTERSRHQGPLAPSTLRSRHELARWTGLAGDHTEAARLFAEVVQDRIRVLGPDHPDTMRSRWFAAGNLGDMGQYDLAIGDYQHILAARAAAGIGEEDSETLQITEELADAYKQTGDLHAALPLYRRLETIYTGVLGLDNRSTLRVSSELADTIGEAGDPAAAVALLEESVARFTRVLGEDNSRTFLERVKHAGWVSMTGNVAEALRLLHALLDDQIRVLGPRDPKTLHNREQIAILTSEAGDHARAVEHMTAVVDGFGKVYGADDTRVLESRHDLAVLTRNAGNPADAARQLDALVPDRTRVLGAAHPETLLSRRVLAEFIGESGHAQRAVRLLSEALPDCVTAFGAGDEETLRCREQLARWTGVAGLAAKAASLFEVLSEDTSWTLGANHPVTLERRRQHAEWTAAAEDLQSAAVLLGRLADDYARVFGAEHPSVEDIRKRALILHLSAARRPHPGVLQALHLNMPGTTDP
ncbi:caspase, EACC1-associated type [Micromonospora saelicesensis]|uniref:caspase, EACC1-associated type n=1 Tax=Micromonospora saelicesensis TaxID=285676 RepID=UPI003CEB6182